MHVRTAQLPCPPAGADRVIVTPGAVIVLDGASAFGPAAVSPAAYADRLGTELASAVTASPRAPLPAILATAISGTASALDLRDDHGPSSTVAIARLGDGNADLLVLGDSYIACRSAGTTAVLTDNRLDRLGLPGSRRYRDRLAAGSATTRPTQRPCGTFRPPSGHAGTPRAATGSPPRTPKPPRMPSPSPFPRRRLTGSCWPPTARSKQPGTPASMTGRPSPAPARPHCPPSSSAARTGRRTTTPTAGSSRAPNGTTTRQSPPSARPDPFQALAGFTGNSGSSDDFRLPGNRAAGPRYRPGDPAARSCAVADAELRTMPGNV